MGKGIPGKKIVFLLFALAVAMCLIVFSFGLREKHKRQSGRREAAAFADAEINSLLDSLPRDWTRISNVQGQGWVIFVPCGSQPAVLHIAEDLSGHPALHCEFCDSLNEARIFKASARADAGLELNLDSHGKVFVGQVDDTVAMHFASAPVKERVLTWRTSTNDSLIFVPATRSGEFEILKAEDESPEGCSEGKP